MSGRLILSFAVAVLSASLALAAPPKAPFASIDGGTIHLSDWAGRPVLVVNTASLCAFTPQYEGLQRLYDTYKDRGLVVLAVPSDDFRQELGSEAEVKDFCELNYGLDLPMTEITHVRGKDAHPFYAWLRQETGFVPRWNFNKVLLSGAGEVVGTYGSTVSPQSREIRDKVETLLTR